MNVGRSQLVGTPKTRQTPNLNKQKSKFKIVFPVHALSPSENRPFTQNAPDKVCNDFYKRFFKEKLFPMTSKNASVKIAEVRTPLERVTNPKVINLKSPGFRAMKSRSPDRAQDSTKNTTIKSIKFSPNRSQLKNETRQSRDKDKKDTTGLGERLAHNFTKLRIVSKDRVEVETKKTNYMPLTSKEPLIVKQKTKNGCSSPSDPKKISLYLKLERLAAKKSRSIEPAEQNLQKSHQENSRKTVNQSEDKNQTKYLLQDNFFKKTTENTNCFSGAKSRPGSPHNKYFRALMAEMSHSEEIQMISDHIRKVFGAGGSKGSFKPFKFKTQNIFYRIVEKIGMGCFGKVYLATQVLTNTPVALKVISKTDIQSKNFRAKIEKEIEVLKMVNNNRYVIKLMEVFEDDASVYFVFEYLNNGDLIQFFRKNPLMEESDLKVFFFKILKGVEYLHKNRVIHRDIKLDNILLDEFLQPKLCDFGISSVIEEGQRISDTGGTPAYLAPEVIKAEGEVCEKSDVWSLGVLLFLLNFGTVPFKSSDMQTLYSKIIVGHFKFPVYDDVSFDVLDLIKRMLVVDLKTRLSLEGVLKHRWFKDVPHKEQYENGAQTERGVEEVEEAGLLYLRELGFPEEYILQSFQSGAFNHLKACMDSLKIRFCRRGSKPVEL